MCLERGAPTTSWDCIDFLTSAWLSLGRIAKVLGQFSGLLDSVTQRLCHHNRLLDSDTQQLCHLDRLLDSITLTHVSSCPAS